MSNGANMSKKITLIASLPHDNPGTLFYLFKTLQVHLTNPCFWIHSVIKLNLQFTATVLQEYQLFKIKHSTDLVHLSSGYAELQVVSE